MRYLSTRGGAESVDFNGALIGGLAPDGGLYYPEKIPTLPDGWRSWAYTDAVSAVLRLFGAADPERLVEEAASRFHHPEVAPIIEVGNRLVLELFWGPTLSFKDHALQVVARLLAGEIDHGVVLVATSGDTGSAAIEACRGVGGLEIYCLFPEGRVSEFQRRQMTTVDDPNVHAVAVKGTFDDCQRLVKEALAWGDYLAVNSINWGRIAAQVGYYVHTGARIGSPFDVVVPTGNFGNVYSCWTAKEMGVPIETITIANNSNHTLADLVTTGELRIAGVIPTVAPAMDIQVPSNLERFRGDPTVEFRAGWSTDEQILQTVAEVEAADGYRLDPHTATAWRAGAETLTDRPQLIVATAHPAKFDETVETPDWYPAIEELPERYITISPETSALLEMIR